MTFEVQKTALVKYLEKESTPYYAKTLELREAVEDWLSYVPSTFPHYTRHTVRHSDQIILQLSKLLFHDEDIQRPVVRLTAVEAYILCAAAYLHDSGMVVSEGEKIELLKSADWLSWITGAGGAAKRWIEIETLRAGGTPAEKIGRNYAADLQTRYLIAEFFRRNHHERAAVVIEQHQEKLGRFSFGEPRLGAAIASVCVSHGLNQQELEDQHKFPERTDIRGEAVNLRFLAVLLRIGDLLDMDSDRACPLLLNAACPLPPESLAHWTQYQRITHRLTAPDCIELRAECKNQLEHRFLSDWCQWLVDEVRNGVRLMAGAARHRNWSAPMVSIGESGSSIFIGQDKSATYFPSKWEFVIDRDLIMDRLVKDVYSDRSSFVRELVQNSLDATRCQMYLDLKEQGKPQPLSPTEVSEDIRKNYPIKISLLREPVMNQLSGEMEARQILVIEDFGVGMDDDIVRKYFLQIGRSYYSSEEFRSKFGFMPTSRFGVGFLSVFGVSSDVQVETFKPSAGSATQALRIGLNGPRGYLLTEKSDRRIAGTQIRVLLNKEFPEGRLREVIAKWCLRVEFPIVVNEMGSESIIVSEKGDSFVRELPHYKDPNVKFVIRKFPVERPGIEGEFYVFVENAANGERWDRSNWANYRYAGSHPEAKIPELPDNLVCSHGIVISNVGFSVGKTWSIRIDYRKAVPNLSMNREMGFYGGHSVRAMEATLVSRWEELISAHLKELAGARGADHWVYMQRLSDEFAFPEFWKKQKYSVRAFVGDHYELISLSELEEIKSLSVAVDPYKLRTSYAGRNPLGLAEGGVGEFVADGKGVFLVQDDFERLSKFSREVAFAGRRPENVRFLKSGHFAVDWVSRDDLGVNLIGDREHLFSVVEFPEAGVLGIAPYNTRNHVYEHVLLNSKHPMVKWLLSVNAAAQDASTGVSPEHVSTVMSFLSSFMRMFGYQAKELTQYVAGWKDLKGLPAECYPPELDFNKVNEWQRGPAPSQGKKMGSARRKPKRK